MRDLFSTSSAVISDCGRFRYRLIRRWGDGPTCTFIMLNPSTADAEADDPTIRRCIGFAKREGCGAIRVENLFAFRATKPDEMFKHRTTAVGDQRFLYDAALEADGPVIAAWGGDARIGRRADVVLAIFREHGVVPMCLGRTKSGAPRHPLYLKSDAPLTPLTAREAKQ